MFKFLGGPIWIANLEGQFWRANLDSQFDRQFGGSILESQFGQPTWLFNLDWVQINLDR